MSKPLTLDPVRDSTTTRPAAGSLLDSWRQIILTGNLPEGRAIDEVSRWLLITRACVFSMTITSALIGGLLAAATAPARDWGLFALALVGLVVAHATNNMINDYFDTVGGVDTESYIRTQYAPHPLFSGLISKGGLIAAILICNLVDARDRRLPTRGARLAGRRVRARRPLHQRLLRRPAAQAEAPRPRRARRLRGVGTAHDRRHLLRDRRHGAVVDLARERPLRARRHDGPDRQARRQVRAGRRARHPHPAGHPGPRALAAAEPGADGRPST